MCNTDLQIAHTVQLQANAFRMSPQDGKYSDHQVSFKYRTKPKATLQNADGTCIAIELGLGHITVQSSPLTREAYFCHRSAPGASFLED